MVTGHFIPFKGLLVTGGTLEPEQWQVKHQFAERLHASRAAGTGPGLR